ncbi:permease for cytosine/purines, uracil, thiamine, allantoin-domain-containing protein [Amylostereum chailletii]|nr:permease for cytosine/purines, uracil, thiamine, allantoin-domain-containing protein [Amylostereum chailletii]
MKTSTQAHALAKDLASMEPDTPITFTLTLNQTLHRSQNLVDRPFQRHFLTANSFISAISGYAVFLGPLTGIMIAEYYFVRHRRIKLSHLYLSNPTSDYWFWHVLNWRAPVVWLLLIWSVWPSLPGFSASVTPSSIEVNQGWTHIYYMSWLPEFCISATLWTAWNTIAPPRGKGEVDAKDVYGTFRPPEGLENVHAENGLEEEETKEKETFDGGIEKVLDTILHHNHIVA